MNNKSSFRHLSEQAIAELGLTIQEALRKLTDNPNEPIYFVLVSAMPEGLHTHSNLPNEGIRQLLGMAHSKMQGPADASFYAIVGGGRGEG